MCEFRCLAAFCVDPLYLSSEGGGGGGFGLVIGLGEMMTMMAPDK